jgi:hypothetical protein
MASTGWAGRRGGSRALSLAALAIVLAAGPGAAAAFAEGAGPTGAEILRRMDEAMAFRECEMAIVMEDRKASGQSRSLSARILWAKGAGSLVAFTDPPREKGKRVLMIADSMWMGVPGVSRPVRLSGKDAFMGSSFTNDDLMNFDREDDYAASAAPRPEGGWILELTAKSRNLPYPRVTVAVGSDCLPLEQRMYLLSGELSKTLTFSEPRDFGGKRRPALLRVEDAMTRGASTTVRFESIVERPVDRSLLSPSGFMR